MPARAPASEETRQRIIGAALETVRREGIVGASARAIARTGGFNQALIFYHFGSVNDLLLAAVDFMSDLRMQRYEERLAEVDTLPELVAGAKGLHAEDVEGGHIRVLSQMVAGSSASPELAAQLLRRFDPWIEVVEGAISRVIAGTPYEGVLPVHDLAFVVAALFLGIELLTHLDTDNGHAESLYRTIDLMAALVGSLLQQPTG